MADVTRAPRTKDFGSTSIHCLMLSSTNYQVWSMRRKEMIVGMQSVTHEEGVCNACLAEKQIRHSLPSVTHGEAVCDTCFAGKQIRDSFPTKAMVCTSKPLGLLLGYLCGRIAPPTLSNHREAFYRFKRFHTDRGGERRGCLSYVQSTMHR
uniref:Uncharacterized protein n=1 Tax=Brassica oleracea TaxID=3712 RepID=A0A3P6HAR6_BRAOL|nr:unnamed protein product [Brassica oleracea]